MRGPEVHERSWHVTGPLYRRTVTQFPSGLRYDGKENPDQRAKDHAIQYSQRLLGQDHNYSTEEHRMPDKVTITTKAAGGAQILDSKHSLETRHFTQEIPTVIWIWVMLALGKRWKVTSSIEYLFSRSRESKERILWVKKSNSKPGTPPLSILLTVWNRAVSSLLMSSTRIVDLLWVIFPKSFHLVKRNAAICPEVLHAFVNQRRRVICYGGVPFYKLWFTYIFKS